MECLPLDIQYCLLDIVCEDSSHTVLALAKTCRGFTAVVESWLGIKMVGCRLFCGMDGVCVLEAEVAYLVARPHGEWFFLRVKTRELLTT